MTSYSPQPDLRRWNWHDVFHHLPVATMDEAVGVEVPVWRRVIVDAHDSPAALAGMSIRDDLARCRAPVLHLAGWYDFILGESLEAYQILTSAGHAQQVLLIGPWTHTTIMTGETKVGNHDFGVESSSMLIQRIRAWFDHWMKGKGAPEQGVKAYVTGQDAGWLHLPAWPPPGAREMRLHLTPPEKDVVELVDLAAGGRAACGRGSLRPAPGDGGWMSYTYDPADPPPTLGGAVWPFAIAGLVPGPADQRPLLRRADGLAFVGPALTEPVTSVGPLKVHLVASIDCPDTDFAARLIDVGPDGEWRIVQDGIARARFRRGAGRPASLLRPGEQFPMDIDLWAAGHRFGASHRIGVHLAGANFPKYARNLNTGGHPLREQEPRPSLHSIRLGQSYLSLSALP